MNDVPQREDRYYDSEGDDDQRSPFERDRDAVLYSTAFRRLAGVTQVVSPTEGSVYHNRLTHTLEVAQIAQRIAQKLCNHQPDLAEYFNLSPDVVETAALCHDLGHPPFGHIAEKELNKNLLDDTLEDGYEGNAQSFRIVTKLCVRNDSLGLNLTRASLDAILKYPWGRMPTDDKKSKKWGAYNTELIDFQFARKLHDDGNDHQSLEAQIMDWADDIAYSIHDTEDFYRAGLIPLEHLAQNKTAQADFIENVFKRWEDKGISPDYQPKDLAREFVSVCDTMPFTGTYQPTREKRAELRGFTSNFIGRYVSNTKLADEPAEDGSLLSIDDNFKMQVKMLKELTWQYVIKGPSLLGMQHGQRRIIRELYRIFAEAVVSDDPHGDWAVLPSRNRSEMDRLREEHGTNISKENRFRVVADAIAGMTDQQAVLMFQRLTGISCGSVLDAIVF